VIPAISHHRKWSVSYNVRLALVRHPLSPLATILAYLPEITVSDLRELAAPGIVPESLRKYLQAEVQRRMRTGGEGRSRVLPRRTLLRPSQNKSACSQNVIAGNKTSTTGVVCVVGKIAYAWTQGTAILS